MENYQLVKPNIKMKKSLEDYKQAFKETGETMDGSSWLESATTIDSWLAKLVRFENSQTVPAGLVPALQYVLVENEQVVGMINLRLELNEYLSNFGGHVGYSVHPAHRRKGHATEMLRQVIEIAPQYHLKQLLITCNDDNLGSSKTIEANGGILQNKVLDPNDNCLTRRYLINFV